jgi:hypothetical protein
VLIVGTDDHKQILRLAEFGDIRQPRTYAFFLLNCGGDRGASANLRALCGGQPDCDGAPERPAGNGKWTVDPFAEQVERTARVCHFGLARGGFAGGRPHTAEVEPHHRPSPTCHLIAHGQEQRRAHGASEARMRMAQDQSRSGLFGKIEDTFEL